MRFRDRPVEQKIFLTILPICLLPAIAFLVLIVFGMRVTFERAMGEALERNAVDLAQDFDLFLDHNMAALRTIALESMPKAQAGAAMTSDSLAAIASKASQTRLASAVVYADALPSQTTRLLAATADPEYSALRDALLGDVEFYNQWLQQIDKITSGGLLVDHNLTNTPSLPQLVYHMLPTGNGLLFFISKPRQYIERFRRTLRNTGDEWYVFSSSYFAIEGDVPMPPALFKALRAAVRVKETGRDWYVLEPPPRHIVVGAAQSQRMKSQSAAFPREIAWSFIFTDDMEAFLGPQDTLIWLAVLLVLVLVLVLLVVAIFSARSIVAPLHELRKQAGALAAGNLDVQVAITSRDEVGRVAEAFNIMAAQLRKSYAALEERLEENRLHTEHIYVLNQLTNAVIQALSLDRIFEILCEDLHKICSSDAIWIALLDRDEEDLAIAHIQPRGLITHFDRGRIPSKRSLHGRVVLKRETHHAEISALHRDKFFETQVFKAEGFQSLLIAPLPGREGIIGTLTVTSTQPEAYSPEISMIMTSLANAIAVAIEQTTLFQQISHMASELERKIAERTAELRRATRKLLQTEKYFATGRMAGNLGHEINNPLGIIKNYLSLVRTQIEKAGGGRRGTDPNLAHIRIIDEEVNRIAGLVRQLLDLHRPVEHKVQPVQVGALLDDILALMSENLRRMNIRVVCDYDRNLPVIIASPDLLRQVFINLIRNAQDAMESPEQMNGRNGEMTIRVSSTTQWEDGRELHVMRIRITDNGCGIPPDNLSQIFDPFFSTKSGEKGSGLGLCISYGIVRMYRGTIDVESKLGEGTSILVSLPLLERDAAEDSNATALLEPDPALLW